MICPLCGRRIWIWQEKIKFNAIKYYYVHFSCWVKGRLDCPEVKE